MEPEMAPTSLKLAETTYEVTETANGLEVSKKCSRRRKPVEDAPISTEVDLVDAKNNLIETKHFTGRLSSTVKEIKMIFTQDVDIFICDNKRVYILDDCQRPYLKCYELQDGVLHASFRTFVMSKLKPTTVIPMTTYISSIRQLRKLTIMNLPIHRISLEHLTCLRYVRLINNGLTAVGPPNRLLEFCDMRCNLLKRCSVRSKVLILQDNRIERFRSAQHFKYLNLEGNPLKSLECSCEFLNIRNTRVATINSNARFLLADGVKNIKVGECPNLKVLYVSNCQLTRIGNIVRSLIIFKARNNYFQSLPKLEKGTIIDVSGNFLESIRARSVVFLNISKNQISEINLKRFPNVQQIDISFNPLEKVLNETAIKRPKSILVNNSLHPGFTVLRSKSIRHHNCARSSHYVTQYKLKASVEETAISMYIITRSKSNSVDPDMFLASFDSFKHITRLFDMFCSISEHFYRKMCALDPNAGISVTLITSKHVFVRSFQLPIFFSNFSEMDILVSPEVIRVFNNVSNWCTFPIFCRYAPLITKRSYSFFRCRADCKELLQFNNFTCANMLEFFETNNAEFFLETEAPCACCNVTKTIYLKRYNESFESNLQRVELTQCNPDQVLLGVKNINFNMSRSVSDANLTNITNRNPVFLYMKLCFVPNSAHILHIEELNLLHIVEFYSNVFEGRMVEKNYTLFIIGFKDPLCSALFGLRIHKVLKSVGIEVGIGIAGEAVFRTEQDGIVYFGGPVFNKASRIADLGIGVFCCRCVKFSSPLIEMFDEGERYLKGFNRRHRIFSLKLVEVPEDANLHE